MPLTFPDIKNAKPATKPYRLSDGGSLYFLVQPNGNTFWRCRYRFASLGKRSPARANCWRVVSVHLAISVVASQLQHNHNRLISLNFSIVQA